MDRKVNRDSNQTRNGTSKHRKGSTRKKQHVKQAFTNSITAAAQCRDSNRHEPVSPTTAKHGRRNTRHGDRLTEIQIPTGAKQDNISVRSTPPFHTNQLRNVVYYQNRFIVLDSVKRKRKAASSLSLSTDGYSTKNKRTGNCFPRRPDTDATNIADDSFTASEKRAPCQIDQGKYSRGKETNREMDATSVTMDSCTTTVPEIVVSGADGTTLSTQPVQKSFIKKITCILLDNRMKGQTDEIVLRDHPEEYRQLKRVLNIVIVTVGIALLLSVCVVIIYTAIVPSKSQRKDAINTQENENVFNTVTNVTADDRNSIQRFLF